MFQKALLAFVLLSIANPALHAQERTWKDSSGKYELIARLVKVTDKGVLLKKADGDTKLIPLDKLSSRDQAIARDWLKANELPDQFEAVVASVSNKGSLSVISNGTRHKVVIAGIATPHRGQNFNRRSTKYLNELVKGKTVLGNVVDREASISCDLIVEGERVDHTLLKNGYAWHDINQSIDKQRQKLEDEARAAKLNLWSEPAAAPWEWKLWSKAERQKWLRDRLEQALAARREVAFGDTVTAVWPAKVVAISDGDTITALNESNEQIRIRLAGIDAPEKGSKGKPGQPYGQKSREVLGMMLSEREVVILETGKDRYGRTIAFIELLPNKKLGRQIANEEMIRLGMAWHYKQYSRDASLAQLENEAKAARQGLWIDAEPVAPWAFRSGNKE